MSIDHKILGFVIFAAGVRHRSHPGSAPAGFHVRAKLPYAKSFGVTALFIGVLLGVWWFLTHGPPDQRIVQPLILPSPMEVLRAFIPLHTEQGLVRSIIASWARVTTGFALAAIVAIPLGVYMATFAPIAAFFRPLALAGAYVPIVVFIPLSMTCSVPERPRKLVFFSSAVLWLCCRW